MIGRTYGGDDLTDQVKIFLDFAKFEIKQCTGPFGALGYRGSRKGADWAWRASAIPDRCNARRSNASPVNECQDLNSSAQIFRHRRDRHNSMTRPLES
jgi:hypothetical protein